MVITAIVFGLSLNLLADFMSGIPVTLTNPYSLILAAFSILLTAFSFLKMVNQYLGDECHIKGEFVASFVWNTVTGDPIETKPVCLFQEISRVILESGKINTLSYIKSDGRAHEGTAKPFRAEKFLVLCEAVLRFWLRDSRYFDTTNLPVIDRPEKVELLSNPKTIISLNTIEIPGKHRIDTKKLDDDSLVLEIRWSDEYYGTLRFTATPEVKILDESGGEIRDSSHLWSLIAFSGLVPNHKPSDVAACVFRIEVEGSFSPLKLQVGKPRLVELIEWTNALLERTAFLDLIKTVMLERSMKAAQERARRAAMGLPVDSHSFGWH